MLTIKQTLTSFAIVAAFAATGAQAQQKTEIYVTNSTNVSEANPTGAVKVSDGTCVQTGSWNAEAAKSVKGCQGYVAPVAPKVEEAKPVVVPKVETTTKKFELRADTLFAFNKYDLKPAGKDALDALVAEVQAMDPTTGKALVVGYTDPIGSLKYNMGLSERRANTVREYLISKGAPADKITAEGRGPADQVTGDTCKNVKPLAKRIECLAPDRRVEITVTGSAVVQQQQ